MVKYIDIKKINRKITRDGKKLETKEMKTKPLTFLLALTFLFLFSGSSVVVADDLQDAAEAVRNKEYEKAYNLVLPLAQQGNPIAQFNLGALYSNGQGVTQDFKEAIKWFQLAAKQEYPNAQYSLGLRYMQGQGVAQDFKEAIKWFRRAEENGFTKARGLIEVIQKAQEHKTSTSEILEAGVNELIKDGIDAAQSGDFKTAHKIFSKYAKLGFAKAQYFLGAMHFNGDGVVENIKEATKWWKLAAEQGNADAQKLLDQLQKEKGKQKRGSTAIGTVEELKNAKDAYIRKDYKTAYKLLLPLAEQGEVVAQYRLGVMYRKGLGVPQDDKEAIKWYRLAAEQGHPEAQYQVGWMHYNGKGVPQDDKEAIKWYRLSAEQGDALAQGNLGWMYQNGEGVTQDNKEAIKWYRLAADQGDADAQKLLDELIKKKAQEKKSSTVKGAADDLRKGIYALILKEYKKAYKLLLPLAEQGNLNAQNNLAWMYFGGVGVKEDNKKAIQKTIDELQDGVDAYFRRDYKKAYKLLLPLAEQGNPEAMNQLASMYFDGVGVKEDNKKAIQLLRLAAEQGHARSQYGLGSLYKGGEVVPQDYKKVEKWWKLAAEKGNPVAQSFLGKLYADGEGVSQDYKEAVKWWKLSTKQGYGTSTLKKKLELLLKNTSTNE
jgi:uncharacterized protein